MKTILSRLKTVVIDNGGGAPGGTGTLSYVLHTEVIHPELGLTLISKASLPAIFFTPINTRESWIASQEKEAINRVYAYLIMAYYQRESSILGDATRPGGQGKGIMDFAADFLTIFRGHRLAVAGANYLNKPLDIMNIDYIMSNHGENAKIIVAQITMECRHIFLQTALPGNV